MFLTTLLVEQPRGTYHREPHAQHSGKTGVWNKQHAVSTYSL